MKGKSKVTKVKAVGEESSSVGVSTSSSQGKIEEPAAPPSIQVAATPRTTPMSRLALVKRLTS